MKLKTEIATFLGGGKRAFFLIFNGTNTLITCGSDASLEDLPPAGDMTVDGWVYVNSDVSGGVIIGKGANLANDGWAIYTSGTGDLRFRVNYDTSTTNGIVSIPPGKWVHFAAFWDLSTKKMRIAINGSWGPLSSADSGTYISDATDNLLMGRLAVGWFNGYEGWLRISNNDRYSGAVGTGFTPPARTEVPAVDGNTVEIWGMNEGAGTNAAAVVNSPANDGTIANGSWGKG